MKCNLNSIVYFRLEETAEMLLSIIHDEMGYKFEKNSQGEYTAELWRFMDAFGRWCLPGVQRTPFVENSVHIVPMHEADGYLFKGILRIHRPKLGHLVQPKEPLIMKAIP